MHLEWKQRKEGTRSLINQEGFPGKWGEKKVKLTRWLERQHSRQKEYKCKDPEIGWYTMFRKKAQVVST